MVKRFWNRYRLWIIITVVFLLIITVFSKNTVIEAMALRRSIRNMQREQEWYRERSREDSAFLENLKSDWFLEKYARENFYMKSPGEEIYLIGE